MGRHPKNQQQNLETLDTPAAAPADPAGALEAQSDADSIGQLQKMIEDCQLNSAVVRVMRRGPMESKAAYCTEFSVSDFDFERVKKMFGGGEYTFVLLDASRKFVSQRRVNIDPRFRGQLDGPELAPARGGDALAVNRSPDTSAALLKEMMEKSSADNRLMLQMMMENSRVQIATITAALSRPAEHSSGGGVKDWIPLIIAMQQSRGQGGGGGMDPMEFLAAMQKANEMFGQPREEKESGFDKLMAMAPGILAGIGGRLGVGAAPVQQAIAAPIERTVTAEPAEAPQAQRGNGQGPGPRAQAPAQAPMTDLARILELSVSAARKGGEVELYADLVIANVTEKEIPLLQNVLTGPEWFGQMFGQLPDAEQVRPWLTKLRDLVLETLNAPPEDDANGGQPPGANGAEPGSEPAAN